MRVSLSLVLALIAAVAACSSGSDDSSSDGTSPPSTPPGDTPPGGPTDPAAIDAQPAALAELVSSFDPQRGFYHPPSKRVFSLQPGLSSTLARVTVAKLGATTAEISTLTVKGKLPTGHIEAMTYDASTDRFLMVVRAQRPHRIELVTIVLGDADATFETLTQPAPPKADGFMFSELYPRGGGSYLVPRGNELDALTISGGVATWSVLMADQNPVFPRTNGGPGLVLDAAHARLLSFGKLDYDVATKTSKTLPVVSSMPLAGPYTWTDLTLGSPPPDLPPEISYLPSWSAFDAKGQRLHVIIPEAKTCPPGAPPGPCIMQELWVANLQTNQWSKAADNFWQGQVRPFATDDDLRRTITVGDGSLSAMSLDPATPLAISPLKLTGDLGPLGTANAAALSSGKLLATQGTQFRIFDPAAAAPRWDAFGAATTPPTVAWGPALTEDPSSGEILLFGADHGTTTTTVLYALAKDGATLTKLAAPAAGPNLGAFGAAVAGHTLVIAGGQTSTDNGAATDTLDDVWSLDRSAASPAWKKLAPLPQKLTSTTLHAVSPTEVWVVGWAPSTTAGADATIAPIIAIDLTTGTTRALPTHGAPGPTRLWSVAPLGSCFVGFESGDTVDSTQPNLWRCKKDGDGITWETTPLDADDYSLGGLVSLHGVAPPDASRAFFVGPSLWSTAAPK